MNASIDDRVRDIMERCRAAGLRLDSPAYLTPAHWKKFFEAPVEGSFFVVSQYIFNADAVAGIGGEEVVRKIRERQDRLGIKYLADGIVMATISGPEEDIPWQTCGILEFPDKESFVQFFLEDLEMQRKRADYVVLHRLVMVKTDMRMA